MIRWQAALLAWSVVAPQQQPPTVPPPPDQRTVNCAARSYAIDDLVCDDAALRARDQRLAALYSTAASAGVAESGPLLEAPLDWFRRRSLCAFSSQRQACVSAAYAERTSIVAALLAARAEAAPLTATCGRDRWQVREVRGDGGQIVLVLSAATRIVGVALAGDDGPDWHAYLSYRRPMESPALTLRRGTAEFACTLATPLGALSNGQLRQRVEAIDAQFERARIDHTAGRTSAADYLTTVRRLRGEELSVHAEARLRRFTDPEVEAFWHRGRLKFPTATEQELARLAASASGSDQPRRESGEVR